MNTTKEYLDHYTKDGISVEVVFRPSVKSSWSVRKWHKTGEELDHPYNHRSMLNNEVVFDFDDEDKKINLSNYIIVSTLFQENKINFSAWHTGGRGIHIHTFWKNLQFINNKQLFKKIILKTFAEGMGIDYQLTNKHLIRVEYGLNEKTGEYKTLIEDNKGLEENVIPKFIFTIYKQQYLKTFAKEYKKLEEKGEVEEEVFKILNGDIKIKDGRERIMFYLIHKLKHLYDENELVDKLWSWYYYSSGIKMNKGEIARKVKYHWNRKYTLTNSYLRELLEEYSYK